MAKLTKSLKELFKNIEEKNENVQSLNFPSGKEYENLLSQEAENIDPSSLDEFKKIQENEKKYQYLIGEGEVENKPIKILDTRMAGSPSRLRALIEDDSGKRNIVQIHRIKNVKFHGSSIE